MTENTEKLRTTDFDLLVIGGGINGAAIANLAGSSGMSVALVEKGDFCQGTSSRSSKLLHGGIRYLEQFRFSLVYEALRERSFHLREIPYLVHPLRFVIPVYRGDRRPLWMMRLGVKFYEWLAGGERIGKHETLSAAEVTRLIPGIQSEGLLGGVTYYDAQMDDIRLCLENVLAARKAGASVHNYMEVTDFLKRYGKVRGVRVRDRLRPEEPEIEIRSRRVVCAVGPWTNRLLQMDAVNAQARIRTTKGVHIVLERQLSKDALLLPVRRDNRIFFVIPWQGENTLIGTTDTDFGGDPDSVEASREDIEYLLRETRRVFPQLNIEAGQVKTCFAGLRPLVANDAESPSRVSREHAIFRTLSGLTFVAGGKYTTYRRVAEDCLQTFSKANAGAVFRLYGTGTDLSDIEGIALRERIDLSQARHLVSTYGARYRDVLETARNNPCSTAPLVEGLPILAAEALYARDVEMARTIEDIYDRRLSLATAARQTEGRREEILKALQALCPGLPLKKESCP